MTRELPPEEGTEERRPKGIVGWVLNLVSDVRRTETTTVLVLLLCVFLLLLSYYILKPVREALILASAEADLAVVEGIGLPAWLEDVLLNKTGGPQLKAVASGFQAVVLVAYVPLYSWIATKISRIHLILASMGFFVLCLQAFFLLRLAGVPLLGFLFYIWTGIFNVSAIAQFWSFGNDIYTKEQGERLFPVVGIGATAGAPLGSKVADWLYQYLAPQPDRGGRMPELDALQRWIVDQDMDASFVMLQLPTVLLVIFAALMAWVSAREDGVRSAKLPSAMSPEEELGAAPSSSPSLEKSVFELIVQSRYLRLIALVILVLNVVNTMGEFLLSTVVDAAAEAATTSAAAEGAWTGRFYGDFYFVVNVVAFVLQAFAVSRIVKYFGLKGVLFALPIVALGTYAMFALGLGLFALRWAKIAENATDYSIMNTGKAMVWLPTSRAAKYRAKQGVDTLLVRAGDVASAVLFLGGTVALDLGLRGLGLINLGLVAVWLGLTFLLVQQHRRLVEDPTSDPLATDSTRE